MATYQERMIQHLSSYAKTIPGLLGRGAFRGRRYEHILPDGQWDLNLIEPFRDKLKRFLSERSDIKRHQYFHHLNSSQAFAFNLFYPYFSEGGATARELSAAMGIDDDVSSWEFEAVPYPKERTNVDVLWRLPDGATVYCEVKLSESEFGTAKSDHEHEVKWAGTYAPGLRKMVSVDLLEKTTFFAHYQLLRNIWLLSANNRDRLVLFFPRENKSLLPQLERVLVGVDPEVRKRIYVTYVEDVIARLADTHWRLVDLQEHSCALAGKYIPNTLN